MKYGGWVIAAGLVAVLVGGSYAYLMLIGLGDGEPGDDFQGFWFEFWVSLVTMIPGLLILALTRAPAAVACVGAAGALTATVNCVYILAVGIPSWDGRDIALPPAVVALLFAEAARRGWHARRRSTPADRV